MKLELLISAVNAEPEKLIEKMQVTSEAIMINQCGKDGEEQLGSVRVFSFDERGVGMSRNRAIENAKGDILLFSDDDIVYDSGYEQTVLDEFEKHPEAEALFFNVRVCKERRTYWNEDYKRVHFWNAGRYPAYSIAIRRSSLNRAGVKYSVYFGGGARYSCGEDSLFIKDCLSAGIKMYRTPAEIGEEEKREGGESTWFSGYNEKYFFDRGVLYAKLYGMLAGLMGFRYVFAKKAVMCNDIPWRTAFKLLKKGIREGKKLPNE